MLVVDMVLGFVGKTVPQLNIMTAGISVRALVGMMVLIVGLGLTSMILRAQLMSTIGLVWKTYGR
jgi:flagellar biosynthesis protein FliR